MRTATRRQRRVWGALLSLALSICASLLMALPALGSETSPAITQTTEAASNTSTPVEKPSLPSLTKELRTGAAETWTHTGDVFRGQLVSFRVTATLPHDFDQYEHYHLCIRDSFSKGLAPLVSMDKPVEDVIALSMGGQPVTIDGNGVAAHYREGVLTVDFADLRSERWDPYAVGCDTVIAVEYAARLTDEALIGAAGNTNGVSMTFSCDHGPTREGSIEAVPTKVFAYALKVKKVAEGESRALTGARFTIRVATAEESAASDALYLQADGSLGKAPCEFTSGANGTFAIEGVGAGTYTVNEVVAPLGYQRLEEPVTFTVSSQLDDQARNLVKLSATAKSSSARISDVVANEGAITLTIRNKPLAEESPGAGATTPTSAKATTGKLAQTGVGPIASISICLGLVALAISHMLAARPRTHRRRLGR